MRYFIFFFLLITNSCEYPELEINELVLSNTFEDGNLEHINGGVISDYNNTKVLGDYNNDGFNVHITDISDHNFIFVSFDLYIHGSWDGNSNGFKDNDKPDKWILELDPEMDDYSNLSVKKFETTFSNSPCFTDYCLKQSYPENYPFDNIPKTGISTTDLPKICSGFWGSKTSLYKIEKSFKSNGKGFVLRFYDELYQPNAIDKDGNNVAKCDESWSIDNLNIRILGYK